MDPMGSFQKHNREIVCPGVMNAYAGNADEFNCVRLFQEMCQRELKPTMTTYSIMMKCLGGGAE